MSTTVTYKGSTLTTVNNQTRTLKTAGKYLEDDVTLVDVSGSTINNQNKSVNPTESEQSITYDSGYTGLGTVTVGAISSNYIGSNIPVRTASDLTTSASTITTPAGYYSSAVSKSIEAGTATTPATTITTNPAISVNTSTGLVTASYSGSSNVTPTIVSGYVSQGTAGKISTAGNVTYQLTSQPAQTITPTTSNQTIASGIYLTGSQTILGDINLVPSNIKSGVSIFGVQGNVEGGNTFIQDEEDVHGGTIRTITTNQMVSGISIITSNGLHTVASFYSASVNVLPNLQSKTVMPDETVQTVTPGTGYDGLSQVEVGAISSNYVGSNIPKKSSSDLIASGSTVTVPSGFYSSQVTKNIAAGTATTPAVTITTNPTISVNAATGVITASYSGGSNITPTVNAGYISSGTAGRIATAGTVTYSLATQASQTITPTESEQTAVASGKYTTGVVKVGAISSTYVGSGIDRNDSTDLTVSGATVTVPSGYYSAQASKSVASGTAGTPTATKGTVSNHSVSVTPSVTNTTGYITGGTKTGTAVTVSASELVSGTKSITENGTGIDVTNYASVDVEVPGSLNTYIIELTNSGSAYDYIAYNNVQYYTAGDIIEVNEGDIVTVSVSSGYESNSIYLNDTVVKSSFHIVSYNYTATSNVKVSFSFPTNAANVYLSEVSDIVPLSITENGTYTASGATRGYSPISVNVPSSGADVPVFETVWSSDYETTTVTCNKTFAECLAYCQNGVSWAYEIETVEGDEENVFEHALSSIIYSSQSITYIRIQNGIQQADIIYYSDGHIDFIQPSEYLIDKTITQNGFYSPSNGGVYAAVTVSVPSPSGMYNITSNGIYDVTNFASASVSVAGGGGGIAVDDIAMRTISGDITGLADRVSDFAFYGCSSLTAVSFPNALSIGISAFANCYSLTTANFSEATFISTYAFQNCSSLTTVSFPKATSISGYVFQSCSSLTEANFPEATIIGNYAFQYCRGLATISFPLATNIGYYAFANCTSLTTASFPEVKSIGSSAFVNCTSLTTASFPKATYIGASAFYSCTSLTTASFPSVTTISNYAFIYCRSLTEAIFPATISIALGAFHTCTSLTTASFPNATSIGGSVFYNCPNLTTVSFPNVTSVGSYAFNSCTSLTTASFPSVTRIGNYAFRSCYHLLSLYLLGSSFCSLDGTSAFYSCPISDYTTSTGGVHGNIFVPASLYDTYISAQNWYAMSARFVSLTDAEIEALSD